MTIAIDHMSEAELDGLHNKITGAFAFAGLSGHTLDAAVAIGVSVVQRIVASN
jgi:hypothetical protein